MIALYRTAGWGLAAGLLVSTAVALADGKAGTNWPAFRGANALGVAEGANPPTQWSVKDKKNIRWKKKVPGLGLSCPVVWGDKLFVTTAVSSKNNSLKSGLYGDIGSVEDESNHTWWLYCFDKNTGKNLWKKMCCKGVPKIKRHTKASHANCTPATDGKHVVVFFGSEGLYCYDMNGKLLWEKDLGELDSGYYEVPEAQWGFASSPVIHDGKVIVQCDVQKNSFVMALNLADGKELWMTSRNEVPTWGTPTIWEVNGKKQVVLNGYKHIGAYDLKTGKEVWKLRGGGDIPVPTPLVFGDLVFITNAHGPLAPIYAIKASATGDITTSIKQASGEHIAWQTGRKGNYMQTPIIVGDYLYCCRDNGVLTCFEAKTGKEQYTQRLGSGMTGFTASAVAAGDRIYFTSEEGDVYVVKAGPKFEEPARNDLGEACLATPAISGDAIYFRGQSNLICVGEKIKKSGKKG